MADGMTPETPISEPIIMLATSDPMAPFRSEPEMSFRAWLSLKIWLAFIVISPATPPSTPASTRAEVLAPNSCFRSSKDLAPPAARLLRVPSCMPRPSID